LCISKGGFRFEREETEELQKLEIPALAKTARMGHPGLG
jgi:hypothetical protein